MKAPAPDTKFFAAHPAYRLGLDNFKNLDNMEASEM